MNALLHQLNISLRLHARNKMALLYSYLFPTMFLLAFWVLYRYEQIPLARHMGELLTVTVLGGACFGLPTTMVNERERGVWRRYRLTPIPTGSVVTGTVIARYCLLIIAGLLQLALAMGIGMPMPRHPVDLWLAFTCVAFAFIGLGLVIAMMADTVPAVQALGQCIFLPMLIIGGVAVPLATLPEWAQHVSAYFPGRYAVEALQAAVTGDGVGSARFSVLALLLIGASGCLAGAKMFRWDAQQRFARSASKAWVVVAMAAWAAVGLLAESRGRTVIVSPAASIDQGERSAVNAPVVRVDQTTATPGVLAPPSAGSSPASPTPQVTVPLSIPEKGAARSKTNAPDAVAPPVTVAPPTDRPAARPAPWRAVTMEDIDRDLIFTRLPPDAGVVAPIARKDEEPDPAILDQLERMRSALPEWKPGQVKDPVQRVRNFLYVAAVPDVFQMQELERHIPLLVYERLQEDIPKDELIQILYWIATHFGEGDDKAVDELRPLGLFNGPTDMETTRQRVGFYAVKLLGRLTGKITPQ